MTRRMSAILGEYSPAGQGCTRHFSVPPLEYKNSTSYKKYRPNFGLNIQESYGKRPIDFSYFFLQKIARNQSFGHSRIAFCQCRKPPNSSIRFQLEKSYLRRSGQIASLSWK